MIVYENNDFYRVLRSKTILYVLSSKIYERFIRMSLGKFFGSACSYMVLDKRQISVRINCTISHS